MLEEKIDSPVNAKVKKTKKRPAKKKMSDKTPFKLGGSLGSGPIMPVANLKAKAQVIAPKKREAKNSYRKIAVSFVVLTLLLVAAVLYFNFSSLTITIIPAQEKITDSAAIEIVNQADSANLAPGQISGIVKEVPVEKSMEFSASGTQVLGQEVAGKVTIINDYIKNQPLVASTRLLSADGKLFRLKNTINVPAGGRVEAEIYADDPKPEMAIGPTKFTIPGLWAGLQDKIYAQSAEAMQYNEKKKYTIEQSDVDNAVKALKEELAVNAATQLKEAYKDNGQVIFALDNNSVSQEVSAKVGEEKQKFSIDMKIMAVVVAFNDETVYQQFKAKIADALADDKAIVEFSKSDLTYSLENYNVSQGTATVSVNAVAKASLKDGAKIIKKNNLAGLDVEQIKIYLNGLPEVAGYEIKFFPAFIKKAPSLADRIYIEIKK
jgi:hypothetical protein